MGVILLVGAAILAAWSAVCSFRRKREAQQQARQSNSMLSDFMAAETMMKASQLESYKAMLRQPNLQPQQQPPNKSKGIDWEYVEDNNPRRRF